MAEANVLTCADIAAADIEILAGRYRVKVEWIARDTPITGSFWGEPEAGIVGQRIYLRPDTPIHSLLHELSHIICMSPERRATLERNAGSDDLEESAVCYLQLLLADILPGVGRLRLMQDMDTWGYSFRVGSTARWFRDDAADAMAWLVQEGIISDAGEPQIRLRGD